MTIHLLCFTSAGGLPIFSRKRGDCESLPFSTIASLNGVHMYCKSQAIQLKTTYMEDGIVIWKEYEDSITMIGAAKGVTERVLTDLLDLAFNAMIVCVSLIEIKHMKNVEHLKRELKLHCYAMIDKLLDYADNDLLRFTDCILTGDGQLNLAKLIEFSELVGSPFCCVLARHKVVVATEGWWDLDAIDRKLLVSLLGSTSLTRPDVPVFLPRKSPNIAYRLVSVMLFPNVSVCILCGAEPSYVGIEHIAQQVWRSDAMLLESAELCYPRNFPPNLQLAAGILGVILINKTQSKYIMSRNLQQSTAGKRSSSGAHRLDILRTFFHQSVDVIEDLTVDNELTIDTSASTDDSDVNVEESSELSIHCLESYWCSDYHKCHSLRAGENLICILYVASIPTHTIRIMTQKTLNSILSEKDIVW